MGYNSMIICIVHEFSVQCIETENHNQLIQKLYNICIFCYTFAYIKYIIMLYNLLYIYIVCVWCVHDEFLGERITQMYI